MYVHPRTGEAVFSVTTILKNGIPKPGLPKWYAKTAVETLVDFLDGCTEEWSELDHQYVERVIEDCISAPDNLKDERAILGDGVHERMEQYTGDSGGDPHLIQWENFLEVSGFKILEREVTLWNHSYKYAGTADWLAADSSGQFVLGDTKTGRNIHPDHALQVEALSRCEFILREDGTEEDIRQTLNGGILHLRPRSWWWYPLDDGDLQDRNWETFLNAIPISDWRALHPDMVLGKKRWNKDNWGE